MYNQIPDSDPQAAYRRMLERNRNGGAAMRHDAAAAPATRTDSLHKSIGRNELERRAIELLGTSVLNLDSMSDREIRCAVMRHFQPELRLDGRSDAEVAARFDALFENADPATARARMVARQRAENENANRYGKR